MTSLELSITEGEDGYLDADLFNQFDAWVWFDKITAFHPLPR
ncbi:MAG: hypothetical protein ABF932_07375 [Gluconobacter potus]|nr:MULTISPECIES: hypothetical protein [Gluconobacter]